jgi:hypothetical protein
MTTIYTTQTSTGGPFGVTGQNSTVYAPGGIITDAEKVTQRDLNSDVFSAKVETLLDLWLTRYGHEWVDITDVMDDAFYSLVHKRLRSLGELEVHYLTDRSRFVCRMPE